MNKVLSFPERAAQIREGPCRVLTPEEEAAYLARAVKVDEIRWNWLTSKEPPREDR